MNTNLPITEPPTSDVRQFFDKFYQHHVSFPAVEIDATVGFFLKNGFDLQSSRSVSIVLLNQSRADNVNVFQLIDTLKTLSDVELSQVVAQILNAYRENTSVLGYRINPLTNSFDTRNIVV